MKSGKQKDKSTRAAEEDRRRNDALNKGPKSDAEKQLPGEYPSREDIMNRMNTRRVGVDVENFSRRTGAETGKPAQNSPAEPSGSVRNTGEDDALKRSDDIEDRRDHNPMEHPVPKGFETSEEENSESDVTEEDLEALGPKDLSMDMGEDERILKNRVWPVDMAGEDLDVPGAELDDKSEAIGSEDEENNSWSLGGDAHEDDLEGK